MNLEFSEEQRLLRDSVERFVTQDYDFATHQRVAALPGRVDPVIWKTLAGFGWLALCLPPAHDGLGGAVVDLGIVMEGLGRGLVLEPVASAAVAGVLLADLGSDVQQAHWLPRIADGSQRLALAVLEAGAGIFDAPCEMRAQATAEGWRLDGRKIAVVDAPGADAFLVSALAGDGPAVFIVPKDTAGLRLDAWETQDDRLAATLVLEGAGLPVDARLAGPGDAMAAVARALDLASAAVCAEALGCMRVLFEKTLAYTKERKQFGQPLAANQVLRHRMVDMAVACEEAAAIGLRAALACDATPQDPRARARAVSGARTKVAETARFVARQAVQLHGAMGVTDELDVGAHYRRLLCLETIWGTRSEHLARCVELRRACRAETRGN